jgi:hypothetical protein
LASSDLIMVAESSTEAKPARVFSRMGEFGPQLNRRGAMDAEEKRFAIDCGSGH